MWNLPGSEIEPESPELTGGFLTTEVPKTSTNTFSLHNNPVRQACKDVSHFKDKDSEVS